MSVVRLTELSDNNGTEDDILEQRWLRWKSSSLRGKVTIGSGKIHDSLYSIYFKDFESCLTAIMTAIIENIFKICYII